MTNPSGQGRIPVLDIGAYLAGEAGAAAPLARAIARTCEDTGFLVVANHGVPQHLVDDTFAVAQQFFARPEPDKLALKIGKYNIGYLPFGGQVVRHSPVNKNTKPNFSESFYITRDRAPDHPDIVNNKPLVGLNRWPEDMPELRAATTAYYRAMEAMTTRLVPLFALALDLPADYFAPAFAEPNCTIRLIHYPPHPSPEDNEFGFAPHTDNNFITFLAQSKLPGLEVRTAGPSITVVKTTIGSAGSVAAAIDKAGWQEVAGTVSGDDTIFIATADARAQSRVLEQLRNAFGV